MQKLRHYTQRDKGSQKTVLCTTFKNSQRRHLVRILNVKGVGQMSESEKVRFADDIFQLLKFHSRDSRLINWQFMALLA